MAGWPLLGFGFPEADATVHSVRCESDAAVDDVEIQFAGGYTAFVQAKRELTMGAPFRAAVKQWEDAALRGLDPSRERLVLVSGALSGTAQTLQSVLARLKFAIPGSWSAAEEAALKRLTQNLGRLDEAQVRAVLQCAVILELQVEEPTMSGGLKAISALGTILAPDSGQTPTDCWRLLCTEAGLLARRRAGHDVDGLVRFLAGAGATFLDSSLAPASAAWRTQAALERYRQRLTREGDQIDLRGLQATIPRLKLSQIGPAVPVLVVPNETGSARSSSTRPSSKERDLLWAFLRRGRAVLTGLPGSGKSTSVKKLAADLCTTVGAPLPVVVSLRDVDARDHRESLRDRIVAEAIKRARSQDRPLLGVEFNRLLDTGGIALLLDALDETYERRGEVVKEIEQMLDDASGDVDVLLVTRDIAYGQASTLQWTPLEQGQPNNVDDLVSAVLTAPGVTHSAAEIADRSQWVHQALLENPTLLETPLIPILLALLARERPRDSLPVTRAETLLAVVRDVVSRYEVTRRPHSPLSGLSGAEVIEGLVQAYAVEGACILEHSGRAPLQALIDRIATEVGSFWGLPPGKARVVAHDAINFFDESGIFVKASDHVAARISLFAEAAAAIYVTQPAIEDRPSVHLQAWAQQMAAAGQVEPLVLAAALDADAADAFTWAASRTPDPAVLKAAIRARDEGVDFSGEQIRRLQQGLITLFGKGGAEHWDLFGSLLALPLDEDLRPAVENSARVYDDARQLLVNAALDLKLRTPQENLDDADRLVDLLALGALPDLNDGSDRALSLVFRVLRSEGALARTQRKAAELLLGVDDRVVDDCRRLAGIPNPVHEPFRKLLAERGFEVPEISSTSGADEVLAGSDSVLMNLPRSPHRLMLDALIEHTPESDDVQLTYHQRARMHELADLLETLKMNDAGCHHMFKQPEDVPRVLDLFAQLRSFDLAVIGAQAQIVHQRVQDDTHGHQPFYALFDGARGLAEEEVDWSRVADVDDALSVLNKMMYWGFGHAWVAAMALWECHATSIEEPASHMLRGVLPHLVSSPRHFDIAAKALLAVTNLRELHPLSLHREPLARQLAAELQDLDPRGHLTDDHRRLLLDDSDAHVRVRAIDRAVILRPPDLVETLTTAAEGTDPGWTCRSCRTTYGPGQAIHLEGSRPTHFGYLRGGICSTVGCRERGPVAPTSYARAALDKLTKNED